MKTAAPKYSTSLWTRDHVAAIASQQATSVPLISRDTQLFRFDGLDVWDSWPLQLPDGTTADFDGWAVWMMLASPILPNPGARHDIARIRLITRRGSEWRDCGDLLPDSFSPGSREWAGSALFDNAAQRMTLFFTATGRPGEDVPTYEQRLFQTTGRLNVAGGYATTTDWTTPVESFASDDMNYVRVNQSVGQPGHIKAFRDPAHFRDPKDNRDYLVFTGSLKNTDSNYNGVVGIACSDPDAGADKWTLFPPLISGNQLNNELERPHIIFRDGHYYLFWSTQTYVFSPDGPKGPNGLYGMVAPDLLGPYRPLNGTGLVAQNPSAEPLQTYSWWVMSDFQVASFVDYWGMGGAHIDDHPERVRSHFGGVPTPFFKIAVDGDKAWVETEMNVEACHA